jgi:thiamine transport system ATP-binding protein
VRELLDMVDLAGMGDRDPEQLSGGQQQRVALARALAPGPEVLLLDEPMSALDARLREQLRRQVKAIQSELGITTVYVTHDQEEALAVSDRVAVLSAGEIEQVGEPQEVYRRPGSRFVATFVGENNLFDGEFAGRDGDELRVRVGNREFELAGEPTPGVDREGDPVAFCVRPESLSTGATTNRLEVTVDGWEFLGEACRVRGEWQGRRVVLRVPDPPEEDVLAVGFDPEAAHVVPSE